MGDSVAGARIVGAGNDFLEFYGAQLAEGLYRRRWRPWSDQRWPPVPGCASATASLVLTAWQWRRGAEHDQSLSGRRHSQGSGRVIDQIAVTPIESVWLVHEGHAASSEREATFALGPDQRGRWSVATLPRINSTTRLQAAMPALESARLTSFDWVAIIIKAFAVVLIAAAMASLLGALMQALARREPEMAVLRAMGRAGGNWQCWCLPRQWHWC